MPTPILATKLYIPPPRVNVVVRPRLIERLNEGLRRKLTLISAPAGFGKTTLVSEWIDAYEGTAAWLSLDEGDKDPARFWSHFIAALQTLASNIGAGALGALQSPQPPLTGSILTSLLNEIVSIPHDFFLVLDDYHIIESKQIDHALAFLIERLPPQMHLVIATREDPDLPLARLRARDQLIELRVKELRFTESEAAEFLNRTMGLLLSPEDVASLEARTEGWIVGLQLAALSGNETEAKTIYRDALQNAHRIQSAPLMLITLTGLAQLESRLSPDRAAGWLTLILSHPAAPQDTKDRARQLLSDVEMRSSTEQIGVPQEQLTTQSLEELVGIILK